MTTVAPTKSRTFAKLLCGALAAAALATTVMPQDAEAGWRHHRRGWGVGAGILGGLAAGALIAGAASAHPGYYAAPVYSGPDCYWVKQRRESWDGYVVVRRVRVCE